MFDGHPTAAVEFAAPLVVVDPSAVYHSPAIPVVMTCAGGLPRAREGVATHSLVAVSLPHIAGWEPSRRIALTGASNFRDLGGYPTEDGRRVLWRRVFRSDSLGPTTERDARHLVDDVGPGLATSRYSVISPSLMCMIVTPSNIARPPFVSGSSER